MHTNGFILLLTLTKKWLEWVQQYASPIISTNVFLNVSYRLIPSGHVVITAPGGNCGLSGGRRMHTEQHSVTPLTYRTAMCQGPNVSPFFLCPAVVIQCNCRPLKRQRLIFLIHCLISQDVSLTVCLSACWKVSQYQTYF